MGCIDNDCGFMLKARRRQSFSILFITTLFIISTILTNFKTNAIVLVPPNRNLAFGRHIVATHTCGEVNGRPIREMYCTIAG